MARSDAPHISMETAIAAKETQLASVENVRRASVELQRACQDIVREADREKEDTREKEHALQDSLAYIAIEPYRERLGDNRRGALVLGYRHSARLGHDVKVVAAEKSDYCKLAEASSEEETRNILKRLDSSEDERNAEQAAWTEWKENQERVAVAGGWMAVDAPSGGIPSAPAGGIPSTPAGGIAIPPTSAEWPQGPARVRLQPCLTWRNVMGLTRKKDDGAHQNVKVDDGTQAETGKAAEESQTTSTITRDGVQQRIDEVSKWATAQRLCGSVENLHLAVAIEGPNDVIREIEELQQDRLAEMRARSVEAGITRANEIIKLRKKIWGLKKGKRDGAHKKKHDGAHQNVKGIDLRPVPKVRRTTEEIAYLESFHVHDGTQADDGDDGDADSRSASTVSLPRPSGCCTTHDSNEFST